MAFTYVGVVGEYKYADGTPVTGTVKLELPRTITNDGSSFTSVTVTLQNGQIPAGTQVPALNDPGTFPLITQGYKVTETVGGQVNVKYVYVRSSDAGVFLGAVLPTPDQSPEAAVAAHEAKSDPHPVYLTQAEGDGRYAATSHNHDGVYAPASHTHSAAQVTGLAAVATSGAYSDLSGTPSIPSGSQLMTGSAPAVADLESEPTMEDFNALLQALRNRGVIS